MSTMMSGAPSKPFEDDKNLELATTTPDNNNVLCDRGLKFNRDQGAEHPGNEQYRRRVDQKNGLYLR